MIKVQRSNSSLCARCKHSTVVEGESVEIVHCHSFGKRMSFKVVNCSSFLEKNQPDEYRMREIAWILRTDPLRRKVGFAAPGSVAHRKLKHETPFPGDDGM